MGSLEGVEGPRHATRRFICQNIVSPFVLPDIYRHTEHVDQALLSRGATRDPRDRESETACRGTRVCVSRSNLNVLLRREGTERAKDAYVYMHGQRVGTYEKEFVSIPEYFLPSEALTESVPAHKK